MEEYEEEKPREKERPQPPPFQVGEQVLYSSPVTGRTLVVEFRGWEGNTAVVNTTALGFIRVKVSDLRKKDWL